MTGVREQGEKGQNGETGALKKSLGIYDDVRLRLCD